MNANNIKRLMSGALVGVMALSTMSMTAFAANSSDYAESEVSGGNYVVSGPYVGTGNTPLSQTRDVDVYTYTTTTNEKMGGDADKNPANYGVTYSVTIPQKVHLTNASGGAGTYTQAFDIVVKGLIGENQTLSAVADKTVTLTGTGFATGTKTCTVSITKASTGDTSEVYTYANGLNAATGGAGRTLTYGATADLTPGAWDGTMNVAITLATK
jgi:hypothetical protein